jgi:hypothetical protein
MVGGNLVHGQEAIFIFNGGGFNSTVPPIPSTPPQTVFYVNQNGNDNNSGFSPAPADAFATIQGAINAIKSRYISQSGVTIRVSDGFYSSGFSDDVNYIASWNIIGNSANPSQCVISATSSNAATYVPGSAPGRCVVSGGKAMIHVEGFTFEAYLENAAATEAGYLSITNCNFTAGTSGQGAPIASYGSAFNFVSGNCQYTSNGAAFCLAAAAQAGTLMLGYQDPFSNQPLVFSIQGTPSFTAGTGLATENGVIWIQPANTTFTGAVPVGPRYTVNNGGGIIGSSPLPGSQPGVLTQPGWLA